MYKERSTTSILTRDGIIEQVRYALDSSGKAQVNYFKLREKDRGILIKAERKIQIPPDNAKKLLEKKGTIRIRTRDIVKEITIDDFVYINIGMELPQIHMTPEDLYQHQTEQRYVTEEEERTFLCEIKKGQFKHFGPLDTKVAMLAEQGTENTWQTEIKAYQVPKPKEQEEGTTQVTKLDLGEVIITPPHPMAHPSVKYQTAIREVTLVTKKLPEVFFLQTIFDDEQPR